MQVNCDDRKCKAENNFMYSMQLKHSAILWGGQLEEN